MKDVIERIKSLRSRYPDIISVFKPTDIAHIEEVERSLGIKLPNDLKELYLYSDGMGFIDYGMSGIANRKQQRLSSLYSRQVFADERKLPIIGTCCGHSFLIDYNSDNYGKVWYIDLNTSTTILVAQSIHEFFVKFLDKIEILIQHFDPKDIVAYFDDDGMPLELSQW
jgi:cell wall assembly regulator SMI1